MWRTSSNASILSTHARLTVRVSTSLRILFLGDSVSVMTAQMYQELARATDRHVIRYSWGTHEGTHLANVDGGGIVAGWRITGWMLPEGRTEQDFANTGGAKWIPSHVPILLNHSFSDNRNTTIDQFDAMILRIPHGWMTLEKITRDNLIRSLQTAHDNFKFRVVIITTLPIINNVQTLEDWQQLQDTNTMLRDFAATYHENKTIDGLETILTLEFDVLIDQLIQHNGRLLGYNETEISSNSYLFDQCCRVKRIMRSKPVVCAVHKDKCHVGNGLTIDGMHWCNESLNGRLGAGISCLLQCAFRMDATKQAACSQRCNERFMRLNNVTEFRQQY